jgi:8-oxo-dGTP pyrophosphatase MutT (NUDIX family)
MDFLDMSKADVLAWAQQSLPTPIDKITVDAAVAHTDYHGTSFILLLKRSGQKAYYPNDFEIPGGKVDDTDASIRDAIAREVAEETDLTITNILTPLAPLTYTTEKIIGEGPLIHTI